MFKAPVIENGKVARILKAESIEELVAGMNLALSDFMKAHHIRPDITDTNYAYALDTSDCPAAWYYDDRTMFHSAVDKVVLQTRQ